MLQRVLITGSAKPGTKKEDIQEVVAALVFNSAPDTLKWTKTPAGPRLSIPRHKYNKLIGVGGRPDLVIGNASVNANGWFRTEVMLGWTAQEMLLGETVTDTLLLPKSQIVQRIECLERIEQAEQRLRQAKQTWDKAGQQVGQAGRASPKQAALLKRSRLTKARARNVLRATQDAYPEQVLGGDYSSQSKVYQLDLLGLIDDRKRGASPYLLTPQQVEMALSYYVFLLAHNLPFLDIQTLRITEADAFYQWVVPDVADLFSVLRYNIINVIRPSQRMDVKNPNIIRVTGKGRCEGITLESFRLRKTDVDWGLLRMYTRLAMPNGTQPLFDLSKGNSDGIQIDWPTIIDQLRHSVSELPVMRYPNDLRVLLTPEGNASRALAIQNHPETWQHYLRLRSRPNTQLLDQFPRRWHEPPVLSIQNYDAMRDADVDLLVAAWLPDGTPLCIP